MVDITLKKNDLSKIKWIQENFLSSPDECLKQLFDIESTDPFILANKHNLIGIIQFLQGEYFEGHIHLSKAIEISDLHDYLEIKTKALINISCLYIRTKQYTLGLECGFESLKFKSAELNAKTYNNLAKIYEQLGMHEKQLEFANKAKSLNERAGEKRFVVFDLFNIAGFFFKQGKFEKALSVYEESLEIIEEHKIYISLGFAYKKMAEVNFELKQYEKSLDNCNNALKYAKQFGTNEFVDASFSKAKVLYQFKQYNEALTLLDAVLAKEIVEQDYSDLYELKIEIELKHKPEQLVETYRDYIKILKSDSNKLNEKNDLTNILKYKEKEIEEVQKRNEAIEQQNRELEVVSKLLAHDLKTPIRTIGSFVNLIKNKLKIKSDNEINDYIEYISSGTQEIYTKMNVTEKYLNFKLSTNKTQFHLNTVLDPLINSFQSNEQKVKIKINDDLSTIYGDKTAIRRMFEYLFRFILKHGQEDQVKINITQKSDGKEDLLLITDDENTLKFAKYWFEEVLTTDFIKTSKVDIGFAFVRKIIKLHHGHLLIDDGQNGKTFLKIWLPVNRNA